MTHEKIEKIEKVAKGDKSEGIVDPQELNGPDAEQFNQLMSQKTQHADPTATTHNETHRLSPIATAHDSASRIDVNKPSHQKLIAQLDETITRIDQVKDKLAVTNDLQLKSSVQTVMRKKLEHIDESLKAALSKVGSEFEATGVAGADKLPSKDPSMGILTPVERFLGMLSKGQSELYNISGHIKAMAETQQVNPAALLAVQIKVNMVQQQIELFTALLNKALESTKTIMNVQV